METLKAPLAEHSNGTLPHPRRKKGENVPIGIVNNLREVIKNDPFAKPRDLAHKFGVSDNFARKIKNEMLGVVAKTRIAPAAMSEIERLKKKLADTEAKLAKVEKILSRLPQIDLIKMMFSE